MSGGGPLPLDRILASVSRSFYLSLRLLPAPTREATALAYLLARAADTVADTRLVPRARRLELLSSLADAFAQAPPPEALAALCRDLGEVARGDDATPSERALLRELPGCFALLAAQPELEGALIRRVLATLTGGMRDDLQRFPGERADALQALDTREELLGYTYAVAGCVGEFWSDLHAARLRSLRRVDLPAWRAEGVRFGRALQLTNVLRDVRRDLEHGRCYLPRADLARVGLAPADLLEPSAWPRLRPLYRELVLQALGDADAGLAHTLRIRPREVGLRLAGLLPLLLAVQTLGLVVQDNPLAEGARRKVKRRTVYLTLLRGLAAAREDRRLVTLYRAVRREAGLPR